MNRNTPSNGGATGRMSGMPPPAARPQQPDPDKLTEAQLLRREQADARAAMRDSLTKAISELGHGADPRTWAKTHPWWTILAASVAGFAAASAVVPSDEQQLLRRLKKLEASVARSDRDRKEDHPDGEPRKKERGWIGFIGTEVFKLARPILVSMLSAAIAPAVGGDEKDSAAAGAAATSDPDYDETVA